MEGVPLTSTTAAGGGGGDAPASSSAPPSLATIPSNVIIVEEDEEEEDVKKPMVNAAVGHSPPVSPEDGRSRSRSPPQGLEVLPPPPPQHRKRSGIGKAGHQQPAAAAAVPPPPKASTQSRRTTKATAEANRSYRTALIADEIWRRLTCPSASPRTIRDCAAYLEAKDQVMRYSLPRGFGKVPRYLRSSARKALPPPPAPPTMPGLGLQVLYGACEETVAAAAAAANDTTITASSTPAGRMMKVLRHLSRASRRYHQQQAQERALSRCLSLFANTASKQQRHHQQEDEVVAAASPSAQPPHRNMTPSEWRAFHSRCQEWLQERGERLTRKRAEARDAEMVEVHSHPPISSALSQSSRRMRAKWRRAAATARGAADTADDADGAGGIPVTNHLVRRRMKALRSRLHSSGDGQSDQPSQVGGKGTVKAAAVVERMKAYQERKATHYQQLLQAAREEELHDALTGAERFRPNQPPMLRDRESNTYIPYSEMSASQKAALQARLAKASIPVQFLFHQYECQTKAGPSEGTQKAHSEASTTSGTEKDAVADRSPEKIDREDDWEEVDLSFHPVISERSRRLAAKRYDGVSVYERLHPSYSGAQPQPQTAGACEDGDGEEGAAAAGEQGASSSRPPLTREELQDMLRRTTRWQEAREEKLQKLREELASEELKECVFTPSHLGGREVSCHQPGAEAAQRSRSGASGSSHPFLHDESSLRGTSQRRLQQLASASEIRMLSDLMVLRASLGAGEEADIQHQEGRKRAAATAGARDGSRGLFQTPQRQRRRLVGSGGGHLPEDDMDTTPTSSSFWTEERGSSTRYTENHYLQSHAAAAAGPSYPSHPQFFTAARGASSEVKKRDQQPQQHRSKKVGESSGRFTQFANSQTPLSAGTSMQLSPDPSLRQYRGTGDASETLLVDSASLSPPSNPWALFESETESIRQRSVK